METVYIDISLDWQSQLKQNYEDLSALSDFLSDNPIESVLDFEDEQN